MPDLLGVTNPVPGYDSTKVNQNIAASHPDNNIPNIADTTRVNRPDARTGRQDNADISERQLRYDSNFQAFIQKLRDMPEFTAILTRALTGQAGRVSSGIAPGLAEEISQFLDMLPMNEGELLSFLKQQSKSGSRFGGALFSMLRGVYFSEPSEGLKTDILQFAKRYSDYTSTRHIEGNILRSLRGIADAIPARWASRLIELTGQLENGISSGDREGNIKLILDSIIPYMSGYVERTHDMGPSRTLLTMLMLDTTRYESGTEEGVLQAFHQLMLNPSLKEKLGGIDDRALMRLLDETEFAHSSKENSFANHFIETAARALRGEGGNDMKSGFKELISAMLINESVYMPVNHYVIPMQWNGKMMYSEMWVDPDADRDQDHSSNEPRTLRFLFKLDIQGLGMFDIVLANRAEQVDMQVLCPEKVAPFSSQMESALTGILKNNGLTAGKILVSKMDRPLNISQVFPKIYKEKGSINVKV